MCTIVVVLVVVLCHLILFGLEYNNNYCFFLLQFVIDASNRQQVAAATIQLLELLTDTHLQSSLVLIVLNKRLVQFILQNCKMQNIYVCSGCTVRFRLYIFKCVYDIFQLY